MSLFDFFSAKKASNEVSNFAWIQLNEVEQLDFILQKTDKKVVLFKHSTRCHISINVLRKFEKLHQDKSTEINFYWLDLLNYRSISNEIAERFAITHQSPQIIVLEKGKIQSHASHYDILEVNL